MYSKKQVDDMLDLVEQEFEDAMISMNKSEVSEETEVKTEEVETSMTKSEEITEEVKEEEDYQSIDELYTSMTKSEKEAHYEAAKKALYSEEVEMTKSEETSEEVSMEKSEIETVKEENEELKKSIEATQELLEKLFAKKSAPEQRAVTGLNVIAKSEGNIEEEVKEDKVASMTKSEITSKLKSVDYSDLTKSDRNAINEYCLNNASVESIKHLITE